MLQSVAAKLGWRHAAGCFVKICVIIHVDVWERALQLTELSESHGRTILKDMRLQKQSASNKQQDVAPYRLRDEILKRVCF